MLKQKVEIYKLNGIFKIINKSWWKNERNKLETITNLFENSTIRSIWNEEKEEFLNINKKLTKLKS